MRVYLANNFSAKDATHARALELKALGFTIVSSWFSEMLDKDINIKDIPDWYLIKTATRDVEEIHRSDILVLFTTNEIKPRGGKHWECGYAYGIGKTCITVGPKENLFYFLSTVPNFPTWELAKDYLIELKRKKLGKK